MTNRIEALTQRPIEKAGHETDVDPMGGNARGTEPDRATAGHCRVRHDHATGRGRPHHSPVPGRSCDASAVSASGCPGASWLSQTRRSDGGSESPSIINGCFSSDRNTNSSRISNSLLFAAGSPQIAPIDIGAQFFASDSALRGPLDRGAVLRRHTRFFPLLDGLVARNPEDLTGCRQATEHSDCLVYWCGCVTHRRTVLQEKLAMQVFLAMTQENIAGMLRL